jgi:hypothetical protein
VLVLVVADLTAGGIFCHRMAASLNLGEDGKEGLYAFDGAHLRPVASVYLAQAVRAADRRGFALRRERRGSAIR